MESALFASARLPDTGVERIVEKIVKMWNKVENYF